MTHFGSARLLLSLTLAASLAACAKQVVEYSPTESASEIRVTQVGLVHDVRFAPGSANLSAAEAQRLLAFVARDQVGYGDRVVLPNPRGATAEATQLAQRQSDAVAAYLSRLGLAVSRESSPGTLPRPANQVSVVVARAVVTPPNCGNWSKPPGFDPTNSPGSNFGCATAYNFAVMVADPNDLLVGRTPGPADGEQQAASVNRYRSGNIIPLQSTTSRSGAASAGASQSGGTAGASGGGQ